MFGYEVFSEFYDKFMENVNYGARAEYVLSLFEKFGEKPSLVLDLGCGTGEFIKEFSKKGIECIGADPSAEMLSVAREKCPDSLFLNQSGAELDLYGTVDSAVCLMDTLNHITEYDELCETISKVSLFLEPGKLFVFDVNTEYKHREVLADNAFIFENDEIFCTWRNFTDSELLTDIYLDFFKLSGNGMYERSGEDFSEKAYSDEQLKNALNLAGMELLGIFGDMSSELPTRDAERVYYVARKVK